MKFKEIFAETEEVRKKIQDQLRKVNDELFELPGMKIDSSERIERRNKLADKRDKLKKKLAELK